MSLIMLVLYYYISIKASCLKLSKKRSVKIFKGKGKEQDQ